MPQNTYRANLTAAEFPFLTELQGRNVIIPGIDQNYSRQLSSTKNKDRDIGIPQVYYMHNVVPTDAGMSTVAYQQLVLPPADGDNTFYKRFELRDPNENVATLGVTTSGRCYVLLNLDNGWVRTTDKAPIPGGIVSTAHVNGQTYIYFGGVGCFKYNFTTKVLDAVTLTSLDPTKIKGICASSGYMIAWTDTDVLWSSTVDPTDFTPSTVTGAGGGGVQSIKGPIVCCLPQNGGFIVYTKKNAVAESYTNNAQYPFNAREIIGAGGLSSPNLSAYNGNSTNHYVYSTSGIQEISMNNASIMFPQATDFIAGSQFEDFDETTLVFTVQPVIGSLKKRVAMISNRYALLSYGMTQLTHALLYDMSLERWGKLKINHVDCFEYSYPSSDIVEAPKRSIGFLQSDGTIIVGIMSYDTTGSNGVVILGKYQLDRNRYLQLQEIDLESIKTNKQLSVKVFTTVDGNNISSITTPTLTLDAGNYRKYNCRVSGMNHSIMISGSFHMHSMELKFADAGAVR